MSIGKAVAICENLDSEEHSIEDKLVAIHEVMNMPTHMSVKKDTLVGMIKWLWNFNLEVSESHSGKRIVEISTPHGDLIDRDYLLNHSKVLFNDTVISQWTVINAPAVIKKEE